MASSAECLEKLMTSLSSRRTFQLTTHLMVAYLYGMVAFNYMIMAFHGAPVPHTCIATVTSASNSTNDVTNTSHSQCATTFYFSDGRNETVLCTAGQWMYTPVHNEWNIVSQFDLVCSDAYLANLATTIFFAGVMLGGLVFGDLADRYGRLPVMLFTLYTSSVLGVIIAFSVNYTMFVVLRFLEGILMQGLQASVYTYTMEIYVARHRPFAVVVTDVFFASGVMALSGLAYALPDWRHLQILSGVLRLVTVCYTWYLPESLRWLVAKGKMDKASVVIARISKLNKLPVPAELWRQLSEYHGQQASTSGGPGKQYHVTDMFREPQLRKTSLIFFFLWFTSSLGYYGLTFKMSTIQGNRYLFFFAGGGIEAVLYCFNLPILKRFGRKKPIVTSLLLTFLTCIASVILEKNLSDRFLLPSALATFGRCAIGCAYTIIYFYTSENFPTVLRNISIGACSFWAQFGNFLAPQLNYWMLALWDIDAVLVFGLLSILAVLVLLPLPETHNKVLPDLVQELVIIKEGGVANGGAPGENMNGRNSREITQGVNLGKVTDGENSKTMEEINNH